VALVVGDRCLVKDQTDPIENGIYNVEQNAWNRAADWDGNRDVARGTLIGVSAGDQVSLYECATNNPIEPGTTPTFFAPYSGAGGTFFARTQLEIDNSITPTNYYYEPGNVFRYGAIADSALGAAGTDCTTAFQNAIDSGHAVYVPEGYFSIEGTLLIQGVAALQGGKTFVMTSNTRLERFSASNNDPILQICGSQNYVDGNGGILAARSVGGFTEGLMLVGVNPTVTDNADTTIVSMNYNKIYNWKIIGSSANTGYDGSVGLYVNSSSRKRGIWKLGGNVSNVYYNQFEGIAAQQFDFPIHISTEASFNSFVGCSVIKYGHAAVSCLGYGNSFSGFICEEALAQDATERFVFLLGKVNDPLSPETGTNGTPTSTVAITGISAASAAVVTAVGHGLTTEDRVWIDGVVDNGPDGDLETAFNQGAFQVTRLTDDTFSVPLDTSGFTNTYVSGGTMQTDYLPNLGSRTNYFNGSVEFAFVTSTSKVRLMGWTKPSGAYDVTSFEQVYGENVLEIQGTHPGGIGMDGFTTAAGIGNNIIRTPSSIVNRAVLERSHDLQASALDDGTGSSFGTDEFRVYSGRMASMAESSTYDVITIDNVGPTATSVLLKLDFAGKEQTNQDVHAGEISWLLPVTGGSEQTAIKIKDFQADFGGDGWVTWSIVDAAGTDASTGKFTLRATTGNPASTGVMFYTWKVELVHAQLEGTNLDWDNDVTITNGGL
jgi:hypothetical protein